MKKANEAIPEPLSTKQYSGKFMVRVLPEVHRGLSILASENHISLKNN
ncbi:toxin-antitoxin system HicB family antitoxin [Abyssogena phaseoliformis symbiont]|nr:toxin-antitoxin system HicB family antitoxin [Abyssogena phaseoliformis symbiont]